MRSGNRVDPSAIFSDPLTGQDTLVDPAAGRLRRDQLLAGGPQILASEEILTSRRRWHTEIGQLSRLLGEYGPAADNLTQALVLAGDDPGTVGLARLRLAVLWQNQALFEQSDPAMELALLELKGTPVEHFAWQHMGRNHLDAGRADKARFAFERALRLRVAIGDDELITATRLALALLPS